MKEKTYLLPLSNFWAMVSRNVFCGAKRPRRIGIMVQLHLLLSILKIDSSKKAHNIFVLWITEVGLTDFVCVYVMSKYALDELFISLQMKHYQANKHKLFLTSLSGECKKKNSRLIRYSLDRLSSNYYWKILFDDNKSTKSRDSGNWSVKPIGQEPTNSGANQRQNETPAIKIYLLQRKSLCRNFLSRRRKNP